jgi:glycosyltransferase involved in cell wall biosynthesis
LKLSIIIPCYNEEKTIREVLKRVLKLKFHINREIIVVDDGSTFKQINYIEDYIDGENVKYIRLKSNRGKGFAIRVGLKHATGNIILVQDADLEYNPKDIEKLLEPFLQNKSLVVYGTRFKVPNIDMSFSHFFGNKFLTKITNLLYKTNLTDMETGYKLFSIKVLTKFNIEATEFEFEPEITSKLILNGYKIIEIPISYKYRKYSYTKITIFDGLESFFLLVKNKYFISSKLFHKLYLLYKNQLKKKFIVIYFKIKSILSKI